ncbi:MAG: thiamine phosphate synthase [Xanthomonadales bacterium]|nr:thiamine phosphate synthase [Xanthomonadales bacterium]NIN59734.1 thiamine phosphate synthase [Xanthomonadales bacterium]NIN75503.1 thiamine phosphate synthase [Xanthomonadales bacterium]NIO15192.1 thiamine phosphate synthase [Xanthomonadales bacterium]NIP12127.1 thiamine phosphate synthase [Xanthomonadales bacterium]
MSHSLPRNYAITGPAADVAEWWRRFERLVDRVPGMVQLRCKALALDALRERAARAQVLCAERGIPLLLNGPAALVSELGLAGVHLGTAALLAAGERPLGREFLVGASCHSAAELRCAAELGASFACLSPVFSTRSHPQAQPLGVEGLRTLVAQTPLPVFALGGVGQADRARLIEAGAHGIAGISAFWG